MESKNPFFKTKTFSNTSAANDNVSVIDYNETMTVSGTINKSFILLMLLVATAFITWTLAFNGYNPIVLTIGGAIVGLILVLVSTFKPHLSTYLARLMLYLKDYLLVEFLRFLKQVFLELLWKLLAQLLLHS